MPVDGGFHCHFIVDVDSGEVPFPERENGTGYSPIDGHGTHRFSSKIDLFLGYGQMVFNGGGLEEGRGDKKGKKEKSGEGKFEIDHLAGSPLRLKKIMVFLY